MKFPILITAILLATQVAAQQPVAKRVVAGVVTDTAGVELPFSTVLVAHTRRGVVADVDGRFVIEALVSDTLVVRYVGFFDAKVVADAEVIAVRMVPLPAMIEVPGPVPHDKRKFDASTPVSRRDMRRARRQKK